MDMFGDYQVVNLLPHKDISAAAFSTAYVNMEKYRTVEFIITTGANGAGTKAVTLKEAKNVSGSSSQTLVPVAPMNHYYTNAAAAASASVANDTFVKTTLASGTFNIAASTDNLCYRITVDADQLTRASSMTHVGIGIATTSAACIAGAVAILRDPRYASSSPPTALD